jgi:hypothetical protein
MVPHLKLASHAARQSWRSRIDVFARRRRHSLCRQGRDEPEATERMKPKSDARRWPMTGVDERSRLSASEIEEQLLAELQKLPTLHETQYITIRPYSGPKLDRIEPEVGPEQTTFADVMAVAARLQQQYDIDLNPPSPA